MRREGIKNLPLPPLNLLNAYPPIHHKATTGLMEPSAAAGPVEDGLKPAAEPMEQVRPAEEQQKKPSTLPPLPTPQDDGSAAAAAANVAEDELQDTILEPAAPADAVGQDKSVTDNGATAREEQNWTPIPTASTTTTTPVPHTPATPTGKPRPILQGTLIGLFVAIDPAMQRYVCVCERAEERRKVSRSIGIYQFIHPTFPVHFLVRTHTHTHQGQSEREAGVGIHGDLSTGTFLCFFSYTSSSRASADLLFSSPFLLTAPLTPPTSISYRTWLPRRKSSFRSSRHFTWPRI